MDVERRKEIEIALDCIKQKTERNSPRNLLVFVKAYASRSCCSGFPKKMDP